MHDPLVDMAKAMMGNARRLTKDHRCIWWGCGADRVNLSFCAEHTAIWESGGDACPGCGHAAHVGLCHCDCLDDRPLGDPRTDA